MGTKWKKKLRAWRKSNRLLQKQAADKLGVNVRTYQGWEEGKGGPCEAAMAEYERRMNPP